MRRPYLCLLWFPLVAAATVYRWTDAQGVVHYADQPVPGARAVDLPPLKTYQPGEAKPTPPVMTGEVRKKPAPPAYYRTLKIIQPQPESTFHDNEGTLTVRVQLEPALDVAAGHKLVIYLDGKDVYRGTSTQTTLTDLTRGAHMLYAEVMSGERKLVSSDAISFYLQQTSILTSPNASMRPRAPAAPRAPNVPPMPITRP